MSASRGRRNTSAGPSVAELYRGRVRLGLIRDLAMNEWSHAEIAQQLNVPTGDISAFAAEHMDEITEVRSALAGHLAIETAGLWITKRQNRLAEMQADLEDTEDAMAQLKHETAANLGVGSRRHYNLTRIRLAIMAQVANEIDPRKPGPKVDEPDSDNVVHYVIEAPGITEHLT